ncbi:hypothetical protein D3C80_2130470 [compost metagenome]
MIDDLVNDITRDDRKSAAIPGDDGVWDGAGGGSWNAAMSEGWAPPASPSPSHHVDQVPGDVQCSHAPAAER